jgi:ABC transport system ATP-binding/permease protein
VYVKPIRYPVGARFADWYHGLRDGRSGIPDRKTATGHITTPHREMLIRLAQDVFEHERLRFEQARGDAPERIVGATARLDQLYAHRTETERHLTEVSRPLSAEEELWRRIGDLDRSERVVIQRRRTEHRRRIATARLTLDSINAEIGRVEAELAAASETDRQARRAASIRVLRFHEYIHRRLDCYLRSLIRAHPDGAWVGTYLIVPSFLPGWITLDVPEPPPPPPPTPTPPGEKADEEDEDGPKPVRIIALNDPETKFGSAQQDPPNVRIEAPGTAPLHFTLTREGADRLRLRDFGHGHGPYRFGQEVKSDLLGPDDYFDFADRRYYVRDGCTELQEFPLGPVNLIVSGLEATSPGPRAGWLSRRTEAKVRLYGMTFVQREKTLVAVLGRSGAGKSSLLYALIGDLPADRGSLFIQGLDITTRSAQISDKLGYVPQDIDLYTSLTVRQLLTYSFHLRDPGNENKRKTAIEKVCAELKLTPQIDQVVSTLSGGQRRRVSIAIELLSEPALLVLDEPTSGLDPGMDREIMGQLRAYAAEGDGRTVVATTHSTAHLHDHGAAAATEVLVVADKGRPIFFGAPQRVRPCLGVRTYADLMDQLVEENYVDGREVANPWPGEKADEYQDSDEAKEARREAARAAAGGGTGAPQRVRRGSVRVFRRQLWTLIKRQATLLRVRGRTDNSGRMLRAIAVALLPFIVVGAAALLAAQITPGSGLGAKPGPAGNIAISVLTTLAMLSGQALTYGDLVSDFPIIHREHRTGAVLPAVMLSKWLVFAAVAVIEAGLMTGAFVARRPGPAYSNALPPLAELFCDLAALTITAMSLGLLISSLARKLEQAVALVTLTSITQIALNGVTAQLSPFLNVISVLLPDRWGLAAAASSVDLDQISLPPHKPPDALWQHTSVQWTTDLTALAVLAACYAVLATLVLRSRMRPRVPRRQVRSRAARQPWHPT